MNLYPALKASMGTWEYYIIKMKMKDIVKEVDFASELYNSKTLDEAIQRTLNEGRVKKEIVKYLGLRDDRFFASIVVAALGGNPTFMPVRITDDERFVLFKAAAIDEAFGVLTFDGGQKYYALDGQHRLKAIKTLIEQSEAEIPEVPAGFSEEEVSVIMLVREEADDTQFLRSYRRIFSSLNRYAKPTDTDTNIIMDEDDAIAILTRRLLIEHEFFHWKGGPDVSPKLKTKGKNLRSGDPFFTTLQTLYSMNERLLRTARRERQNFASREYKQFNPGEDELDTLYAELDVYWNAILAELPVLRSDPTKMRAHDPRDADDDDELQDSLLFWPIGQEVFADVIRVVLNRFLPDPDHPSLEDVSDCVRVLADLSWDLHQPPWRGLILIQDSGTGAWKMRNEERKRAVEIGRRILRVQVGVDDLPNDDLEELKIEWDSMLIPRPDRGEIEELWSSVHEGKR